MCSFIPRGVRAPFPTPYSLTLAESKGHLFFPRVQNFLGHFRAA